MTGAEIVAVTAVMAVTGSFLKGLLEIIRHKTKTFLKSKSAKISISIGGNRIELNVGDAQSIESAVNKIDEEIPFQTAREGRSEK